MATGNLVGEMILSPIKDEFLADKFMTMSLRVWVSDYLEDVLFGKVTLS